MTTSLRTPDVLVVGGGIAGAAAAFAAAARGLAVRILATSADAGTATWQSGGMLAPKAEGLTGELLALGQAALHHHDQWQQAVRAASGQAFAAGRGIWLPLLDGDAGEWWARYAAARAAAGAAMTLCEPGAWPGPRPAAAMQGAIHIADEGWIDPRGLLRALHAAVRARGGELAVGSPVTDIATEHDGVAVVAAGQRHRARAVVVAAGAAAARISGIDWSRLGPLRGDRGIMLRLGGVAAPPHVIYHHGTVATTYVVPDPSGVRVGSTSTVDDGRSGVHAGELADLLGRACRIWPPLADATLIEAGVGLRPLGPDGGMPTAGPLTDSPRVYGLLGLHRNGMLLAPLLAERLIDSLAARL